MLDKAYKIEKGIKRPIKRKNVRRVWTDLFDSMRIGDSVRLSKKQGERFKQTCSTCRGPGRLTARKISTHYIRIWKVK